MIYSTCGSVPVSYRHLICERWLSWLNSAALNLTTLPLYIIERGVAFQANRGAGYEL